MEQNRLSVGKMFLDLLIRPGSAFQNLAVRTAVWLVIIMAVIAITFSSAAGFSRLGKEFSSEAIMEQPETKKMIEEGMISEELSPPSNISFVILAWAILGGLFAFGIGWMIKSSILLGVISLAGGKLGWKESVAVVGASWVPFFFHHLLQGLAALPGWQIVSFTGAGAVFISHLNIFVLWNIALLTIGFAAVAGISRVKAFTCSAGYQAGVILLNWGLGKLVGTITSNMF